MKKFLISLAAIFTTAAAVAETPLWLRDVQISPNGNEIAFCYKGDIYKVPAAGGEAVRLTAQSSYECSPVWSPDGSKIAFASDRNGNFDVFVMNANGGAATRLTFNSASEIPSAFTNDGKNVLFAAYIQKPAESAQFPMSRFAEVYQVPVAGGKTSCLMATPAEMISFSPDGKTFLYQDRKGYEDEWRKHHTSSVTRDLWLYDLASKKHTNLTNRGGEDRNPVFGADGNNVYFLSERNGGTMNVYTFSLATPDKVKSLTNFKTHPVRFLSVSKNGTMCYAYDGEIYTQPAAGGSQKKVKINLVCDDEPAIADLTLTSGATSAAVSPDGKQVALVVRGDVFVTSVEYGTTKQITKTPAAENGVSWADNRTIAYASERNGRWQIFTAKIARDEELNFPNATLVEEKLLMPEAKYDCTYPVYSPDGKELAFTADRRRLMILNIESGKVRQITDGSQWYAHNDDMHYAWSPDGKWLTFMYIANCRDPYSDIALVSAQGGTITNITQSGYISELPKFNYDGTAITFTSNRYGMRSHASWGSQDDVFMVFLNQDAYDKYRLSKEDYELQKELEKQQKKDAEKKDADKKDDKKDDKKGDKKADETKDILVELDGIHDRVVRLTPNSSRIASSIVSKDGESLYYLSAFEGGFDLWKLDLRKKETKLLNKINSKWAAMDYDKDGKAIFLLGAGKMQKMEGEKLTPISYSAKMRIDLAKEREAMFHHVYRQEKNMFYNLNMHGIDWDAMTKDYSKFLPHINNNYDFAELLSEYLGELNVSHTGGRYYAPGGGDVTANLGLMYDWNFAGNGMKVTEVVTGGPFDHKNSQMHAGCVIEKINGVELNGNEDFAVVMNNIARKKTLVSIFDPETNKRWDEVVLPISNGAFNTLLYNRWVKNRAADVERWSNGRLGYVHVQQMNDAAFRTIYSDILGKYNHCEGIVIDIRFNGGGRLHEDLEILFSGEKYFEQVVRGQKSCDMPSRRWNKPSIMVMCEADYSNAHGSPWVYSHQKIGKLVGMPVPGTMTSVMWETLQDPDLVFGIPIIGYQLPDGSYLENSQLEPDVKVANSPETIVKGEDTQLHTAVTELLKEIDKK